MHPANSVGATAPGPVTPTSDDAPSLQAAGHQEGQVTTDNRDSAVSYADRKAWATLQARCALAGGFLLSSASDGSYTVSRWNLSRSMTTLAEVGEFLDRVGGSHG
jgi:hypothetical protein